MKKFMEEEYKFKTSQAKPPLPSRPPSSTPLKKEKKTSRSRFLFQN